MSDAFIEITCECDATMIPAGDVIQLKGGSQLEIVQNRGSSILANYKGFVVQIADDELKKVKLPPLSVVSFQSMDASPDTQLHESVIESDFSEALCWKTLRSIINTEFSVSIVDLGLIHQLQTTKLSNGKYLIEVQMLVTSLECRKGASLAEQIKRKLESIRSVKSVSVESVSEPQWSVDRINPEIRRDLNIS